MNTNYEIKIDESVLAYLQKKKKNVITLTINQGGGGCCPTIEVADVDMREPENTVIYNKFELGDITVYVSKIARVTAPVLRFTLQKSLLFSSIVPAGLSLKGHQ
tara:strand:- start:366 stop:677 length:312 start_codon:yes stop_codon:yes gene_type:complete